MNDRPENHDSDQPLPPRPTPLGPTPFQPTRRGLLGLTGATVGAAALTATGAFAGGAPALAAPAPSASTATTSRGRTDPESPRFTVVVIPDTQYLFDGDSLHADPLAATVDWVGKNATDENIVFVAHLGDVVQNGAAGEFGAAGPVLRRLDRTGVPWSVLAGNHDINGSTDDQRGRTAWLEAFGPGRLGRRSGYSTSPDGYNSAHIFRAARREWLLLALDWRLSDVGRAWASSIITANPTLPVILTTHELVDAPAPGAEAVLSDYGSSLWESLVKDHDQIFLTVNGHFWPPARTVLQNAAGHDVNLHLANYQDRFFGGAAMIRLYRFDLERRTIDVSTVDPYFEARPYGQLDQLSREEIELTTGVDRFQLDLDPDTRFASFAPVAPRAARSSSNVTVPGTLGLWGRFGTGLDGTPVARLTDLARKGNDLAAAHHAGAGASALTWSSDHHPDAPSHGSIRFQGGTATGDYLATIAGAPLAATTLDRGYTLEAFVKLPTDWSAYWSAAFSRRGSNGSAGKTGGYSTTEPIATLGFSNLGEVQWYTYPLNLNTSVTNWSHILTLGEWYHIAIVNDGKHTVMWIDGCEVVRNPSTITKGIATTGLGWLFGGHEDGGAIDQIHVGWIGDVRVVGRALKPREFMIA